MPRKGRQQSDSGLYHVILRGNNRINIFLDDQDRNRFLSALLRAKGSGSFKLFAYCLMDNHVHLLISENTDSLSICMKKICVRYVAYFNKKYERVGHLFQDRYRSEPVERDDYLLVLLSYVHNNPVRAGLVYDPALYRWSSCAHYYGNGGAETLLVDKHDLLNLISEQETRAINIIRQFSSEGLESPKSWRKPAESAANQTAKINLILSKENLSIDTFKLCKEKTLRDRMLREIKGTIGISARQLAKMVGVSKDMVFRA